MATESIASTGLSLYLLGGFRVLEDGLVLRRLPSRRQQSLIAYLILHAPEPRPRPRIASAFWPDVSEEQALRNLRKLVHDLRHAWPNLASRLDVGRSHLSWKLRAEDFVDATRFLALALSADPEAIEAAADLYAGDFLPDDYEDWVLEPRDALRRQFLDSLERGLEIVSATGQIAQATRFAQRLIREEPLREDVCLSLMKLYAGVGDRTSALRTYHACAGALAADLQVEPQPELSALYQRLLNADAVPSPRDPASVVLSGRSDEVAVLRAAWASVTAGRPGVVALSGEPGIGKTRLSEDLIHWLSGQGIAVAATRCYPGDENVPFGVATSLLKAPAVRQRVSSLDARLVSQLDVLLQSASESTGAEPERASVSGAFLDYVQGGWRHRNLLQAVAAALAAVQPLLIVIDDAQWSDVASRSVLDELFRADDAGRTLLLVITPASVGQRDPLFQAETGPSVTNLDLGPLLPDAIAAIAQGMGHTLDPETVNGLARVTEGNPLFLSELIRTGNFENRAQPAGAPSSVQTAVRARFAHLPAAARDLLLLAAGFGRAFRLDMLTTAWEAGEDELVNNLDLLWRSRIIRETTGNVGGAGAAGYEFTHGQLRDVAYGDASLAKRTMIHRRIAGAFAAVPQKEYGIWAEQAHHLALAQQLEPAARAYEHAAREAESVYDYTAAIHNYDRAFDLWPAGVTAARFLARGRALKNAGRWQEAEADYLQAEKAYREAGDVVGAAPACAGVADLMRLRGEPAAGLERLAAAERDLEGIDEPETLAHILGLQARLSINLARIDEAILLARRQFDLAKSSESHLEEANALENMGTAEARLTHYSQSLRYYERQLILEHKLGDRLRVIRLTGLVGNVHRLRGDLETARAEFERQLEMSREIRYESGVSQAKFYLAIVYEQYGDFENAVRHLEDALVIARRLGDRQVMGSGLGNLGVLHQRRGDVLKAWETMVEGRDILLAVGDRRNAAVSLGNIGVLYRSVGRYDEAEACLLVSLRDSITISNPQNVTIVTCYLAELALRRGETEEADAAARRAVALGESFDMAYWLAEALQVLARVRRSQGRLDEACTLAHRAEDTARRSGHHLVLSNAFALEVALQFESGTLTREEAVHRLRDRLNVHPEGPEALATATELLALSPADPETCSQALKILTDEHCSRPGIDTLELIHQVTDEVAELPLLPPLPPGIQEAVISPEEAARLIDTLLKERLPRPRETTPGRS